MLGRRRYFPVFKLPPTAATAYQARLRAERERSTIPSGHRRRHRENCHAEPAREAGQLKQKAA
ncbi:MAG: hypothetical protein R3D55_03510 [Chloroflexota bacterium]